ncbi:Cyclin, N-terminal [Kalmanozyma brasiliensis GHG001]|uniref:Cyclin-like domain-containing protein n=1 Tax=Kalmanozyma brasiliensis (strain GHG001) TaxID=1365824 RepID=V5GLG4_KALBG|nr:Cyclin, N-terminal [Kalmanozyma brasiliensis GHG001]EST06807.1 Cyclin, N-terminal [Kalmanozyma brasiliensis GHG001]
MSANYWASTQCNNWLLDRPQLELARKEDLKYATALECAAIGIFFSNLLSTICKRLNLRQRVVASANVFFRRFFAKNSYCALDPFLVCATCVYVSAKVEESPIHIKSAVAEAARSFQEVGFRSMPTDNSSLAEMEFYLLEEMEFDMIVFHAYRSLVSMFDTYGNGRYVENFSLTGQQGVTGLGIEAEAFGVVKGLSSVEEKEAAGGSAEEGGIAKMTEFDQPVLQMSWFVLNDAYKLDIPLMYPPYMVALAAIWLALTLHPGSCDTINASLQTMQHKRDSYGTNIQSILDNPNSTPAELLAATKQEQPTPPSQEALTWFASLNVSLPLLAEIVQEIISGYALQKDVAGLISDGPGMVALLERMRESRRLDLLAKAREHSGSGTAERRAGR